MRLLVDNDTNLLSVEQDVEYHEFDLLIAIRKLMDIAISKLDMDIRKQLKITKSEDIGWIIYTNMFDVAHMLDVHKHTGELSDITARGGTIEDIVCMPSGVFPSDCAVENFGTIKFGVLYFVNSDPKCPRCWKRHSSVNEQTGLCPRCQDVIETHYPDMLEGL